MGVEGGPPVAAPEQHAARTPAEESQGGPPSAHAAGVLRAESADDGPTGEGRRAQEELARTDAAKRRDAEVPEARDAVVPSARDAEAPRAATPTAGDVHASAREREAPAGRTGAEGRAVVGATPAGADAGGGLSSAGGVESSAHGVEVGGAAVAADVERRGRVARVREGARERVGRARDEALVALEETPDDSGLRFVVAAVVLFLLFAFLLLLSTTVLR
jgi:hypothetical protein